MLPALTHELAMAATACGGCLDQNLLGLLPFLGWWIALYLVWSLLLGPFIFTWDRVANATDLPNPAKSLLWFSALALGGLFVLQGSVVGPFVLFAPFWLLAMVRSLRTAVPSGWRRFCIIVLALMAVTIPLSYVLRPQRASGSRHGPPPLPAIPVRMTPAAERPAVAPTPAGTPAAPAPPRTP